MFPLEETDWRVLLKSIRQGRCILFLGPGVAVAPADPQGDPFPVRLARRLAAELRNAGKGDHLLAPTISPTLRRPINARCVKRRAGLELATEDFYSRYLRPDYASYIAIWRRCLSHFALTRLRNASS